MLGLDGAVDNPRIARTMMHGLNIVLVHVYSYVHLASITIKMVLPKRWSLNDGSLKFKSSFGIIYFLKLVSS